MLGLALSLHAASAGTIEQALTLAEPQMQVKDGAIQGCGYRLKSFPSQPDTRKPILALDASFNLYSNGMGALKAGALLIDAQRTEAAKGMARPISSFWLKVEGDRPTFVLNGKFLPASTPGYLLGTVDVPSVAALFQAVWEGKPMMIGVTIKGDGIDRIYSGVPQLTDREKAEGTQCFGELLDQMKAALEGGKK